MIVLLKLSNKTEKKRKRKWENKKFSWLFYDTGNLFSCTTCPWTFYAIVVTVFMTSQLLFS